MTVMKEALEKAGVRTPDDRLREIALKAMSEHQTATFLTAEAIWDEVQKDRGLMIHLFRFAWRTEVSALMYRVQLDIESAARKKMLRRPVEKRVALVVAEIRKQEAEEEAERKRAEADYHAAREREYEAYLQSWRTSRVGSVVIQGRPVWENSVATVRTWLDAETCKLRVVEMLIEGVPDDGRPIGFYRRPDEVEVLWERAGGA